MPSRSFCDLLNQALSRVALASDVCQKPGVLGFQPASNTEQMVAEIGPVAWFQRLGSFARMVAFFLQTSRILRLVSTGSGDASALRVEPVQSPREKANAHSS